MYFYKITILFNLGYFEIFCKIKSQNILYAESYNRLF